MWTLQDKGNRGLYPGCYNVHGSFDLGCHDEALFCFVVVIVHVNINGIPISAVVTEVDFGGVCHELACPF